MTIDEKAELPGLTIAVIESLKNKGYNSRRSQKCSV